MPKAYATGSWKPFPGQEDAFVEAWLEFVAWATERPGSGTAYLARDVRNPEQFVSFSGWDSLEAIREWKGSSEFKERMARVQKHIDKFTATELEVVAASRSGAPVSP